MKHKLSLILGPLLFLLMHFIQPLNALSAPAHSVLGLLLWMGLWWVFESLPLFVTALLPILILPVLEIHNASRVLGHYASSTIFLFLGGFILSIAIEKTALHHHFANKVIRLFGSGPQKLVLGFMLATFFLSMWISNTAAALIMVPLALALAEENPTLRKSLVLGIAYASSIGGVVTPIGTPANAMMIAFLKNQSELPTPSFLEWILQIAPMAILGLVGVWWILAFKIFPVTANTYSGANKETSEPLNVSQKKVLGIFLFLALAWTLNPLIKIPGLDDTWIAVLGILLFFIFGCLEARDFDKVAWSILILFGGGLALADGVQSSGLAPWLVSHLSDLKGLHPLLLFFLVTSIIIFFTEFASNTAIAALFIPLGFSMATELGVSPMPILYVITLASSLAFMMPMGTPPNAIAYLHGKMNMKDMLRAGIWSNLLFALLIALHAYLFL